MIFSLWNPLGVPPGGVSGITGELANFCGFCWFFAIRKILFGLRAHRHSKSIHVLPFWTNIRLFSGPLKQKTRKKGQKLGLWKHQGLEFSPRKFFAQIDFMLFLTHMENI